MININYIKSNGELKRLKELSSIECESPLTIEELQQEIELLKETIKNLKLKAKK
jgi:hypothetical protein